MSRPCLQDKVYNPKLDGGQTLRGSWDHCNQGHRVVPINEPYSYSVYSYNADGTISTIKYYYKESAEKTQIDFVADVCGSLNGTSFELTVGDGTSKINVIYSVDCGTIPPCDTCTTNYVLVSLVSNDPIPVISRATRNALVAESCNGTVYTVCECKVPPSLIIENVEKGDAADVVDCGTGFTFCVLTQGVTTLVDTYTYTYDACGNISRIESESGDSLFDYANSSLPSSLTTLQAGTTINPLAKYVEATYTVGDTVVTYSWYESSSKATLYNTITLTYTEAQDTTFTSAEWS